VSFAGNLDYSEMSSFQKDFNVFLEAATEINPVHSLAQISAIGNISAEARDIFIELNQDNRFGYMACIGDNRRFRVLAKFMAKAAERDNLGFFAQEEDAITWINNKSKEGNLRLSVENLS
jgi:hypothetical protein